MRIVTQIQPFISIKQFTPTFSNQVKSLIIHAFNLIDEVNNLVDHAFCLVNEAESVVDQAN